MKSPSAGKPELLRWLQMQGDADRRLLAQLWTLPPDSDPAALAAALTEPRRVEQQWERLAPTERAALTRVLQEGGSLPAAILEREWGVVRDPARFSNPRAYLQALQAPATPAERLYTLGLLVRGHDERGPIFRVLNDLRALLPAVEPRDRRLQVGPAAEPLRIEPGAPPEIERTVMALLMLAYEGVLQTVQQGALNRASLVRLARRLAIDGEMHGLRSEADWPWAAVLAAAAQEAGLLRRNPDGHLHVTPRAIDWLKAPRAERLGTLLHGWATSGVDELQLFCGLTLRASPRALRLPESRQTVLALIASLPAAVWLPVDDIIGAIERVEPDFLRRDGRYDTALIYDEHGRLIAGREGWPRIEGEFVRALLLGPLHWLGLTDAGGGERLQHVRLTPFAAHLLHGAAPPAEPAPEPLSVQGTFEVVWPPGGSLFARFQLARIAEPVSEDAAVIYRLTRRSIVKAAERGIGAGDVLRFLHEYGRGAVPQAVAAYIHEWAAEVGRLRLEEAALLQADEPLRMVEVRRTRGIDLPPVEELTPTTWKIAPGDVPALLHQLDRAGFSVARDAQPETNGDTPTTYSLTEHDLKALLTAAYAYARVCAEYELPCQVSPSMLQRLRRLVPSRQAEAAQSAAEELSLLLRRRERDEQLPGGTPAPTSGGERYA